MTPVRTLSGTADGQNSEKHIRLLAAASQTYSYGKRVLALQIVLAVFGGLAFAIVAARVPRWAVWAAFYSFVVALVDALVLENLQSRLRFQGAQIQERFDCSVLNLPWRWALVGDPPSTELTAARATTYIDRDGDVQLRDWYPPVAFELPTPFARLICQRVNAWWDAQLRKWYLAAVIILLCLPGVPAVGVAIRAGITVEGFVLGFLAPITPATIWGVREISRQGNAQSELARLHGHVEAQWNAAVEGRLRDHELDESTIEIQDQIFVLRRNNPLIFNWVHGLLRERQQRIMTQVAEDLVAQAKAAGIGKNA